MGKLLVPICRTASAASRCEEDRDGDAITSMTAVPQFPFPSSRSSSQEESALPPYRGSCDRAAKKPITPKLEQHQSDKRPEAFPFHEQPLHRGRLRRAFPL